MNLVSKKDLIKLAVLVVFSIVMWAWIGYEYAKPEGFDWREGTINAQASAIEIVEVGDKKLVKNKRDSFVLTVPASWQSSVENLPMALNVRLSEKSEIEGITETPSSCTIDIFVEYQDSNLNLEEWIKKYGPETVLQQNSIFVNNYSGFRVLAEGLGRYEVVYLRVKNKTYSIVNFLPEDITCVSEFNKALNSIHFET